MEVEAAANELCIKYTAWQVSLFTDLRFVSYRRQTRTFHNEKKRARILNALSVPRRNMIFRYSDTFDSYDSVTLAIIYANDSKNKQS